MDLYREYKELFGVAIGLFLSWIGWSLKKRFVPSEDLENVKKELGKLSNRVTTVEQQLDSMPKAENIHQLTVELTRVRGALDVFSEKFEHVEEVSERLQTQLDRLDDFLKTRRNAS